MIAKLQISWQYSLHTTPFTTVLPYAFHDMT